MGLKTGILQPSLSCLNMGGILVEGSAGSTVSAGSASLPTYRSLLVDGISSNLAHLFIFVALGKFSEFGAMTFQPIREVT